MVPTISQSRFDTIIRPIYEKVLTPLAARVHQIAQKVFGYLLRITVFQMGEFKVPGAYWIMRVFQISTCDPRELKPFNLPRLEKARSLLLACGGKEAFLTPADQKGSVHCMTFKAADFFAHFERMGVKRQEINWTNPQTGVSERRMALVPNEATRKISSTLDRFQEETKKFRFPLITIDTPQGIVKGALLPESPTFKPNEPHPIIFHSHSPGRSMCMELRVIGQFVGAGYDLALWDPRGTVYSEGRISEGGEYLDADAVFRHVRESYPANRIYLSGFCKGVGPNAYLAYKYRDQNIPFIAANPFDTMRKLTESSGWFGRLFGHYGLSALQSQDPETIRHLEPEAQDYYDTPKKLRAISQADAPVIIISTDTDRLVPADSAQRIAEAVQNLRPVHQIVRNHPNKKQDGHTSPPYHSPEIWKQWIQHVR